ncbi:amidase [Fictibacillus barbaricus]|uniref:Amidase n=1 Tax=Fictibacillus barbaricus TaxID=182136 RepID=A0ABS2Z9V1_9BACL|nr:amidase [Fictibacillus barbaricus]MBN3544953.1 amidase [Fictibacillus barbaricus]GGB62837.1 hypothetical protein GCM10007199_31020 [Fictibacillus barbaricus]
MKTKIAVLFVFMLIVVGGTTMKTEAFFQKDRATWLWNPWIIVNDESGTLAFLESKQLTKVYVQIDRDVPMNVYRSFIEKAATNGMKVYALDGSPQWVAPKGYLSQDQLMNWLGSYQNGSTSLQQFSGIHLDVEPYLYSGWANNRAETVKSYQSLLTRAKEDSDALNLQLEADLPFWFDEISYKNIYGRGILAEWVISKTNSVTLMAYRDSSSMIIDLVKNEVAYSSKYGKNLLVGVETGQTNEGNQITFFEEGENYMNQQLAAVTGYYTGHAGFGGVAIHHVGSWVTMKP